MSVERCEGEVRDGKETSERCVDVMEKLYTSHNTMVLDSVAPIE